LASDFETSVLNHSYPISLAKAEFFFKFSAILLLFELIPHAGLYFCDFGLWQLLIILPTTTSFMTHLFHLRLLE